MWKVFKRPGRQTSRDSSNSDSQDRGGRSRLSQQISQGMNIHHRGGGDMAQDPASIHNRNNRDDSTVASERSFSGYQAKHNVTKRGDAAGRYVLLLLHLVLAATYAS